MSETSRRAGRARRPRPIECGRRIPWVRRHGALAPALAAASAALLLAACSAPAPWARGTGSVGEFEEASRAEYEVRCEECVISYTVPGEGRQNRRVRDVWREGFFVEPGNTLSISLTVPEAVALRRATVRILAGGEVVAADTLIRASGRRTAGASYTVPRRPGGAVGGR